MLLAQIEAFLTIAERRSVSAAAAVLYVTQPALTTRIKKLERELGIELFVRTPRGMRLTAEGRAFRPHAQRAVQSLAEGRELLREPGCGGTYRVVREFWAVDACGLESPRVTREYRVVDTTPPEVEASNAPIACLWPPNHWYVAVSVSDLSVTARDACSEPVTWRVSGCVSDQPDDAPERPVGLFDVQADAVAGRVAFGVADPDARTRSHNWAGHPRVGRVHGRQLDVGPEHHGLPAIPRSAHPAAPRNH